MLPVYKVVKKLTKVGYELQQVTYGHKIWHLNGKPHRINGPAVVFQDIKLISWYLNGKYLKNDQIQTMKYLWTCPMEELPLYINTIFKPIAEYRLQYKCIIEPTNDHIPQKNDVLDALIIVVIMFLSVSFTIYLTNTF